MKRSCGVQDEVLASGYLLRQGTVLSFNWKKHYWVLTKHGSAPSLCKVTQCVKSLRSTIAFSLDQSDFTKPLCRRTLRALRFQWYPVNVMISQSRDLLRKGSARALETHRDCVKSLWSSYTGLNPQKIQGLVTCAARTN